jgi:hypothetical protein
MPPAYQPAIPAIRKFHGRKCDMRGIWPRAISPAWFHVISSHKTGHRERLEMLDIALRRSEFTHDVGKRVP